MPRSLPRTRQDRQRERKRARARESERAREDGEDGEDGEAVWDVWGWVVYRWYTGRATCPRGHRRALAPTAGTPSSAPHHPAPQRVTSLPDCPDYLIVIPPPAPPSLCRPPHTRIAFSLPASVSLQIVTPPPSPPSPSPTSASISLPLLAAVAAAKLILKRRIEGSACKRVVTQRL